MDKKLLKEIEWELNEDVGNYGVSDLDDLESWSEVCLDCPSNTLMDLLKKIPEDQQDEYYDKIDDMIQKIVEKVSEELSEEDDE